MCFFAYNCATFKELDGRVTQLLNIHFVILKAKNQTEAEALGRIITRVEYIVQRMKISWGSRVPSLSTTELLRAILCRRDKSIIYFNRVLCSYFYYSDNIQIQAICVFPFRKYSPVLVSLWNRSWRLIGSVPLIDTIGHSMRFHSKLDSFDRFISTVACARTNCRHRFDLLLLNILLCAILFSLVYSLCLNERFCSFCINGMMDSRLPLLRVSAVRRLMCISCVDVFGPITHAVT